MSALLKDRYKFFATSVYGLVSMLEEYAMKLYGVKDSNRKYCLYSSRERVDGLITDCVTLKYRDISIKFAVVYDELIPIDLDNIDYSTIKRTTAVVEDCVANLSGFNKPVHSIEGRLYNGHHVKGVRVSNSREEYGAVDIILE